MTKSKGEKLLQELIEKYGDVVVAYTYDVYQSRCIKEDGTYEKIEDCMLDMFKLSQCVIDNRSKYKQLEEVAQGRRKQAWIPVEINDSKSNYYSEEQRKLREKRGRDFRTYMGNFMNGYPYQTVKQMVDMDKLLSHSPSPKEFGMAMDNQNKKH